MRNERNQQTLGDENQEGLDIGDVKVGNRRTAPTRRSLRYRKDTAVGASRVMRPPHTLNTGLLEDISCRPTTQNASRASKLRSGD